MPSNSAVARRRPPPPLPGAHLGLVWIPVTSPDDTPTSPDLKARQARRRRTKGHHIQTLTPLSSTSSVVSFLAVPAEVRVEIYKYLLPGPGQYASDYNGLRNSCRLVREEYDFEAQKVIPSTYDNAPHPIASGWHMGYMPNKPTTMADLATVEILPPSFVVNRMARFPRKMIPWHWTWIKTLVISFNMSYGPSCWNDHREPKCVVGVPLPIYFERRGSGGYTVEPEGYMLAQHGCDPDPVLLIHNSAVHMAFKRTDRMIKDRTGSTVIRRTWTKGERRPVKCDIDTFVLRWTGFDRDRNPYRRVSGDNAPIIHAPASGLPSNHDRLWDVEFGFGSKGRFVEAVWRRRTLLDAQCDAEDDFMPLPEWLELPPRCE